MRDTYFIIDGREIIVAELTDRELGEAFDALDRYPGPFDGTTREEVRERLRIERTIRELGL